MKKLFLKTIKTNDFLEFVEARGITFYSKGQEISPGLLLEEYDDYLTINDLRKYITLRILEEINIYQQSGRMTEVALAEHIISRFKEDEFQEYARLINEYDGVLHDQYVE